MTARRTPANRKPATPAIKLSGELVEVPSEALANEAAAAESIAQDVEAPADEVADAIAELEAEANGTRKAPAKKAPAKKTPAPTAHTDCTHAKSGAEGKKARAACRREKAAEAAKAAKA
ncbi:hypothetical protein [Arthrobacter sp. NicSoilC12]|uniref:hypothetical protein n=1 Tax=Arthrobacter sp. NicSoilC12 TaxID=2831001 RepID=UPI001CC6FC0A|nr:hypothetical protein [Arthrobacter sp. NicSoilC12]GIU55668.1 hypothetical protein NicSoilC12_14170 [Arthrobacter sp. NicSoilC12]